MNPSEISPTYLLTAVLIASFAFLITIISMKKWRGSGRFLCDDCRFNNPTACLKKERPYALVCTSYRQDAKAENNN
jgi:hypothetical protein